MIRRNVKKSILTILALLICGVLAYYFININITRLQSEKAKIEKKLTVEMQKNRSLVDENQKILMEKQELEKAHKDLKSNYDELDEKYQEEVSPVSFNPGNVLEPSKVTASKLSTVLKGTGLSGLEEAYLTAEKEYGVNAIFLISLTAEESGWGTSRRSIEQNNMSGFQVYSSAAKGRSFSSKTDNILETAKLLKNNYLSSNGKYFSGYSINSINIKYCPNDGGKWSRNITTIGNNIKSKINSR